MDKRILLVCSAGMSTSLLVQKMKKVAESQGKKYEIWATPVDDIVDDDKEFPPQTGLSRSRRITRRAAHTKPARL